MDNTSLPNEFRNLTLWQWIKGIISGDSNIESNINDFIPLTEEETDLLDASLTEWITNNSDLLLGQIVLTPLNDEPGCSFENLQLQYLDPDDEELDEFAYWKLVRFIRLKNKLKLSYQQLDEALYTLYGRSEFDLSTKDVAVLDLGISDFLNRYALMLLSEKQLKLKRKKEWHDLLCLWGPMDYHYPNSLFKKLFLATTPEISAEAFLPDITGALFSTPQSLESQSTSLLAAFKIDQDSWDQIFYSGSLIEPCR